VEPVNQTLNLELLNFELINFELSPAILLNFKNSNKLMRIVNLNYSVKLAYQSPQEWLGRIGFSAGILTALAKQHEVIGVEQIDYEGTYYDDNVRYEFVRLYYRTPLLPLKLHRLVKKLRPDVVMVQGLIFPIQVMLLRRQLGRQVKIYTVHHAEKPFTGIKRWLQQRADKCIDAYQFTSTAFGADWAKAGIIKNMQKVHAIMEASSIFAQMDSAAARQKTGVAAETVYLWVGRLDANKDPLTVVKAFMAFARQQTGVCLYMIYQTEELLEAVKAVIGDSSAIQLIGKTARNDLQAWYSSADFIVAGSHYEGSGIAVCEAMSCGCIPIVTAIHSFTAMTAGGKCGLLYEPGNEAALLAALQQSLQMDRAAGRKKVLQQFEEALSFDAIAGAVHKVLVSL
jgi:glycosyltransferase involved in cell wall biosynthesis